MAVANCDGATAVSANGGLRVRTNDQGLPLELKIESTETRRDPEVLAAAIRRLCGEAKHAAGLRRRQELHDLGVSAEVVAYLDLPEPHAVARDEARGDLLEAPMTHTWLRR